MKIVTNKAEETKDFAKKLAQKYKDGAILALVGPLGSGKTTFTQGFAEELGIKEKILSPTFIIMRSYPITGKQEGQFIHIDLYRLDQILNLEELGLGEIFSNPNNIVLIEWADKLGTLLPKNTVRIKFEQISENRREIIVEDY